MLTIEHRTWTEERSEIETPYVFPVINVIGGPPGPDRNGGIWRPIKWWLFLHKPQIPAFLCQVLHAVDFNLDAKAWLEWQKPFGQWISKWRKKPREEYKLPSSAKGRPDNGYPFRKWMEYWDFWQKPAGTANRDSSPPITFLDSGGFALLKLADLHKAKENLGIEEEPKSILELQETFGGDLVASLDYPLPPGLSESDILDRQSRSITNALGMLKELARREGTYQPLAYVAVHGTNQTNAARYMDEFFRRWQDELRDAEKAIPFGFAIGSMVPRADDPRTVVEVVWGIAQALKRNLKTVRLPVTPPIHVFGINSHLTGLLAYIGVDTFDSTTFADVAQRAGYLGSDLRQTHLRDVEYSHLESCQCLVCTALIRAREANPLEQMKSILVRSEVAPDTQERTIKRYYHPFTLPGCPDGLATKSDLYGLLAIHNWHQLQAELEVVRDAIRNNRLAQYLVENLALGQEGQRQTRYRDAVVWLAKAEITAADDPTDRLFQLMPLDMQTDALGLDLMQRKASPVIGLKKNTYPRDAFSLDGPNEPYAKPAGKSVLLLIACSKTKPYCDSAHQKPVIDAYRRAFPEDSERIHRVTLSGWYGPVPEELEDNPEVIGYDFMLVDGDKEQADYVTDRLTDYLRNPACRYDEVLAFVYFPAYRAVVERAFKAANIPKGNIVPQHPRRGAKPAAYRRELENRLAHALGVPRAERPVPVKSTHKTEQLRLPLEPHRNSD
ncbi:MAG TPA: DUF5591 domain-containing protein [Symbiobacteriaceae bacterium]|nr:DUF5591 domain-containing protein [Symbiobacteriaceae bacterium]